MRASAADKGKERDERASAADEGEALCRQVAVEVAQVRAAEQAVFLEAWQSATANSSDTGDFQAGELGIVSLQLGWTALLVTAACGTGPVHDLILPWHQPISLAGSLLETTPVTSQLDWDAVACSLGSPHSFSSGHWGASLALSHLRRHRCALPQLTCAAGSTVWGVAS